MSGASPKAASPMSAPPPQVIILNGASSVGKTSTARALQAIAAEPYMLVAMDAFLEMQPARMMGHPDGMTFEPTLQDGVPAVAIRTGPVFERHMQAMRRAVAAMAAHGERLIVDEVMWGETAEDYRALLAAFEVRFVGLVAPLAVVEARERARGDRDIGLARWQYGRVHQGMAYDLTVDTSTAGPAEAAELIRTAFGL